MGSCEKTEKIFKAFADKSWLQILECIQAGNSSPGEMSRKLDRYRSTIEKHLSILLAAKIVEKAPSLTERGHLSIHYRITSNAEEIVTAIQESCHKFSD